MLELNFSVVVVELPLRLHANFPNWFPTHSLFEDRQHKKLSVKVSIFGTHTPYGRLGAWGGSKPQIILQNRFLWVSCSGERMNIDWWVFHIQFRIYRPLCWLKIVFEPTTGWRVVWKFIGKSFLATSAYIERRVACRPSLVHRHYSRPCTDRRPIEAAPLVPATWWVLRQSVPEIFRIRSVWKMLTSVIKSAWQAGEWGTFEQTFLVQKIDGTGLPDALHSRVTAPPFLAVIWPLDGTARTLGGTVN